MRKITVNCMMMGMYMFGMCKMMCAKKDPENHGSFPGLFFCIQCISERKSAHD